MLEAEWLASTDPAAMLTEIRRNGILREGLEPSGVRCWASDRKLRLFAVACCRQVWRLLTDERSRRAVEVSERYADGEATREELRVAADEAAKDLSCNWGEMWTVENGPSRLANWVCAAGVKEAVDLCVGERWGQQIIPAAAQAALLREVVGNPWRPATLPKPVACDRCNGKGERIPGVTCGTCGGKGTIGSSPEWLTPRVLALAQACYDERPGRKCERCGGCGWDSIPDYCPAKPNCPDCHGTGRIDDGTLDPDRLLVLADAVEDVAGPEAAEPVLRHLRGEETCPECVDTAPVIRGRGDYGDGMMDIVGTCCRCDGTGWVRSPGPHVRGCWVLDLLLNKD